MLSSVRKAEQSILADPAANKARVGSRVSCRLSVVGCAGPKRRGGSRLSGRPTKWDKADLWDCAARPHPNLTFCNCTAVLAGVPAHHGQRRLLPPVARAGVWARLPGGAAGAHHHGAGAVRWAGWPEAARGRVGVEASGSAQQGRMTLD